MKTLCRGGYACHGVRGSQPRPPEASVVPSCVGEMSAFCFASAVLNLSGGVAVYQDVNDAYLVGSIANGDAEAVRPLIERYRKPLGAVLQRALGASPDVEDVFQEVWIRVVRSAHRYDPEQRFSAWLFAIAWNLVKDRWSRLAPHDQVDLTTMASHERSPEEQAVDRDRAARVREMVSRLPERLAQAVLLRYFEELSEKEVAERLGIPLGTVKSRLHHGLRKLAETMNEELT
jgi:RNA polymerase sigma-70 factor (ECF subfamily)